jgi:endoglucanase
MKFLTLYLFLSLVAVAEVRPRPVDAHGALRAVGSKVVGQDGQPVSLAGSCLFWSQWQSQFWNAACVDWLHQDWHADIIRASVGVEGGGYLENPTDELARVERVADAAIAAGIYVIIDWHDHHANRHTAEATQFFQAIARKYGATPNIIYEIFNEPTKISWSHDIKPYAQEVIAAIRAIDHGPKTWMQRRTIHWTIGMWLIRSISTPALTSSICETRRITLFKRAGLCS